MSYPGTVSYHLSSEKEDDFGLNTNKYINSEGLKGKYNIFIKINNKLYKTNNYVEF